jgi:hypothetical protein
MQRALTADLENMHSELDSVTRSKSLVHVPMAGTGPASVPMELQASLWPYCVPPWRCRPPF